MTGVQTCALPIFGDVLKPYCIDGKLVKTRGRLRSYQRGNVLALGGVMPNVEVTTAAGETVQLADLAESGSPTLVVFFDRPQEQRMTNLTTVLHHWDQQHKKCFISHGRGGLH